MARHGFPLPKLTIIVIAFFSFLPISEHLILRMHCYKHDNELMQCDGRYVLLFKFTKLMLLHTVILLLY